MDQAEQLRNAMNKSKNRNNARVITVTSGKGGVGKSNVAVNLAVQLSKKGKRVIIFDADFGLANVEVMFGAIPQYNLSDLIYNNKSITDIITAGPLDIGFISGGSGIIGLNNLSKEQISYTIKSMDILNEIADFVIVDTGAGISNQVLEFVLASPEVILVTTPEPSSLIDSYSLLKALYKSPEFVASNTTINVIANKVNSYDDARMVFDKLNSVVSQFLQGRLEYLGIIPDDPAIERAVRAQKTVSLAEPNSKSAKAFESITACLLDPTVEPNITYHGISHIFMSLLKKKK